MAPRPFPQILDPPEREILQVLWTHGAATAHTVHERIRGRRPIAYTTVLSIMRTLCGKGLLAREVGRWNAHIYTPIFTREELLLLAVEHLCGELAATPTERQRLAEALQG